MPTIHKFGPFRLDTGAELLFRGAEPMALGQRAVALLRVLVERAGAPVSKDALIEAAWPGLAVEESNLTVQIAALRRVFEAEPGGDLWIETLSRRGYRFTGPAVAQEEGPAAAVKEASRLDAQVAAGLRLEDPAQRRDLDGEIALLDRETRPRGFDQRILGNRHPRPLDEHAKQGHGPLANRHRLVAAEQKFRPGIKAERAELVDRRHRRFAPFSETFPGYFGTASRLQAVARR